MSTVALPRMSLLTTPFAGLAPAPHPVIAALAAIGCTPFVERSVKWYQFRKVCAVNAVLFAICMAPTLGLAASITALAWTGFAVFWWPIVFTALWALEFWSGFLSRQGHARWESTSFYAFTGRKPSSVWRKVEAIHRAFPDASLDVDHLEADPFLVATIGGHRYYVAGWDEDREFE